MGKKKLSDTEQMVESFTERLKPDAMRGTSVGATLAVDAMAKTVAMLLVVLLKRGSITEREVERVLSGELPKDPTLEDL